MGLNSDPDKIGNTVSRIWGHVITSWNNDGIRLQLGVRLGRIRLG